MAVLTLLCLHLSVLLSAFLLTCRVVKLSNFVDALICWIILYFFQTVLIGHVLGIFGILTLNNMILSTLLILLAVWLLTKNKNCSYHPTEFHRQLTELLKNKVALACLALIFGFTLVKIYQTLLINPPLGWDCFTYHFVFPIEWLKHGNLENPIYLGGDLSTPYYPINGSLYFLWLIFPLKNVLLADLGQLPFYLLSFLATYNIARKIGINRELSFYGAGLLLLTPNVFKEIHIGYVDIMVTGLFLASLNFLLALYEKNDFRYLVFWTLSFGLFFGTKTLGIVYGAYPVLFFLCVVFKHFKELRVKGVLFYFVIFLLIMVVSGGYAYIKNILLLGNPLFPAEIKVLGMKIFPGVIPLSSYHDAWPKGALPLRKLLFGEGLGGQFIVFVLPALFLSVYVGFKNRRKPFAPALIFILTLPVYLYLMFLYVLPYHFVKYLYPFLGLSYAAAFYIIGKVNIPVKIIRGLVAICLIASAFELNRRMPLLYSMILSGIFFAFLPKIFNSKFSSRSIVIGALAVSVFLIYANKHYDRTEFDRYVDKSRFGIDERLAWRWLNENTHNARIAFTGRADALPLYGTHFKNEVLYVSVNATHPAKLQAFPKSRYLLHPDTMVMHKNTEESGNYRGDADYNAWLKNLRSERIDYVFVYALRAEGVEVLPFPVEDSWADGHPEFFKPALRNNTVHIYKLSK